MIIGPLSDYMEDSINENSNDSNAEENITYGYNDNLTAKLGGNYSKIIEFYDSRL